MPIPDWVKTEDWEILRLGGVRVPGVAHVEGDLGSGLDIKKPKGGKKATTKDDGDPPGELDVDLDMDHADVVAFQAMLPILRAVTKDGARDPLKCEHPMAYLTNIHNVSVGPIKISHPKPGGRLRVSFKLIEWSPAPVAVKDSKKQPEASSDVADWQQHARNRTPDVAVSPFLQRKPSSDAGKNL
jgi:hypothetical protein